MYSYVQRISLACDALSDVLSSPSTISENDPNRLKKNVERAKLLLENVDTGCNYAIQYFEKFVATISALLHSTIAPGWRTTLCAFISHCAIMRHERVKSPLYANVSRVCSVQIQSPLIELVCSRDCRGAQHGSRHDRTTREETDGARAGIVRVASNSARC